jgi:cytochrome b
MNTKKVWDLPTRVLHWALALSLTASLGIALFADDEGPLFQYHMLFGFFALLVVVLRIIWGIFGSHHARFAHFPLSPRELAGYLSGVVRCKAPEFLGNNPAAAWFALSLFVLIPLLVFTGINQDNEMAEELHGPLAYVVMAAIGAHLCGLLIHRLGHEDGLASSMLTGNKGTDLGYGIRSTHPLLGALLVCVLAAWGVLLVLGHDSRQATLKVPLLGKTISLGEADKGGWEKKAPKGKHREHDDD